MEEVEGMALCNLIRRVMVITMQRGSKHMRRSWCCLDLAGQVAYKYLFNENTHFDWKVRVMGNYLLRIICVNRKKDSFGFV